MKFVKKIIGNLAPFLIAFLVVLILNTFIVRIYTVQGGSMENTLHSGNLILGSKIPYTFNKQPDYEKIVVVDSRVNRKRTIKDDFSDAIKYNMITTIINKKPEHIFWIKRVIGKGGDLIEIKDGIVYRNNEVLEEPYIKEQMIEGQTLKIKIPEGYVFVMGDNRNNSSDSRYIGPIPIENVVAEYIIKVK